MRTINNLRMWQKQLLCCILVFIIPFSVCFYLANSMKGIMMENARRQALDSMDRVVSRLQHLLTMAISTSSYIAFDNQIIEYVTTDYEDKFSQIQSAWKSGDLSRYLVSSAEVLDGFFLYCEDADVLNTGFIKAASEPIKSSQWYQRAAANPLMPFWTYTDNDSFSRRGQKNLSLCRSVYHQDQLVGVLCVYINDLALSNIVTQEAYQTFICDPSMRLVAAASPELKGCDIGALNLPTPLQEGIHQVEYQGGACDLFVQKVHFPGIQGDLSAVILYDSQQVQALARNTSRLYYWATAASGLIALALMLLLSRLMSRRLETIGQVMHIVAKGDFSHALAIDGRDEIGQLSIDLNAMTASLRRLIQENYQIKLEKQKLETYQRDIQLQILSNQINPHFLFNTLESIRMMSVLNGQNEVGNAIQRLSSLMRRSLYSTDTPVLLTEELMRIEDYLSLQKLRLGQRLSYQININGDIDRVTILPFLIQPLVENVIKHGLDAKSGAHSYVIVDINCMEQNLVINVADNGVGMSPETISSIQAALQGDDDSHPQNYIGIRNVSQRIHLFYGPPYALSIHSTLGIGTVVTICIPRRTAKEG